MQHLTAEALARLVDEPPAPGEAQHVRDCLVCRRDLDDLRAMTRELAELPDIEPPAESWFALEARLQREGLVREGAATVQLPVRRWQPALRIAAALALFLLGGATGVLLWGGGRPQVQAVADLGGGSPPADAATLPLVIDGTDALAGPGVAPAAERAAGEAAPSPAGVRLVSEGGGRAEPRAPRPRAVAPPAPSPAAEAAARELAEAEEAYLAALQRYAAIADPGSGADPLTRLAALERLVVVTREALERTPGDPVINGYHMAALTERDNVRRQIAQASKAQWF